MATFSGHVDTNVDTNFTFDTIFKTLDQSKLSYGMHHVALYLIDKTNTIVEFAYPPNYLGEKYNDYVGRIITSDNFDGSLGKPSTKITKYDKIQTIFINWDEFSNDFKLCRMWKISNIVDVKNRNDHYNGAFVNGVRQGMWRINCNKVNYVDGVLSGKAELYMINVMSSWSSFTASGEFVNGKRHGVWNVGGSGYLYQDTVTYDNGIITHIDGKKNYDDAVALSWQKIQCDVFTPRDYKAKYAIFEYEFNDKTKLRSKTVDGEYTETYRNGVLYHRMVHGGCGLATTYFSDGVTISEYNNGNGSVTEYYNNLKHQIKRASRYHGSYITEYAEDGEVMLEKHDEEYMEKYKISRKLKRVIKNRVCKDYYDVTGIVSATGQVKYQGSKQGSWSFYNDSGIMTHKETYDHDCKSGEFIGYHPDGTTIKVKGNYNNDQKVGKWYTFDENSIEIGSEIF